MKKHVGEEVLEMPLSFLPSSLYCYHLGSLELVWGVAAKESTPGEEGCWRNNSRIIAAEMFIDLNVPDMPQFSYLTAFF